MAKATKKKEVVKEQTLALQTPAVKQTVILNSEIYTITKVSDKRIDYTHNKSGKKFFSKR